MADFSWPKAACHPEFEWLRSPEAAGRPAVGGVWLGQRPATTKVGHNKVLLGPRPAIARVPDRIKALIGLNDTLCAVLLRIDNRPCAVSNVRLMST